MVYIDITTSSNDKVTLINKLKDYISNKDTKIFILYFMEGCGPCNATRPEWKKIKNVLSKKILDRKDIVIVSIDYTLADNLSNLLKQPNSFPTIRYITSSGKIVENYEDSDVKVKDRSLDSFIQWIKLKSGEKFITKSEESNQTKKPLQNGGKMNKQKGGILIDSKDDEAFSHFIQNSTFSFLSNGTFGLTVKANLKPGVESKYRHIESSTRYDYGDEVRTIIIKLGFIHDASKGERASIVRISQVNNFETVELQTFKNEVNIQTDIFLKTMNYLQPVCPAIVYSKVYTVGDKLVDLFDTIFKESENTNTKTLIKRICESYLGKQFYNIGLIGMEFADGYELLFDLDQNPNFELYKNMSLYLLLKLAIDTGYTHGDFHPGNIFIDLSCNNYFKNTTGKPLLIDFGQAQKIPINILTFMKEQYKNGNYTAALKRLCDINRPDGVVMKEHRPYYGFACGSYDYKTGLATSDFNPDVNTDIGNFILTREEAIDDIVALFRTKHDENPERYPLLPLSNSVKNSMFEGLITGGKLPKYNKTKKNPKKLGRKWSLKYKRSINCRRPKGFSQKQYCKYGRKK